MVLNFYIAIQDLAWSSLLKFSSKKSLSFINYERKYEIVTILMFLSMKILSKPPTFLTPLRREIIGF